MNFIRFQTRLNTDIYGAYRSLTNPDKINQWLGRKLDAVAGEPFQSVIWKGYVPYENMETLEFYIMKCASKTEYCTEVHLKVNFDVPLEQTDAQYGEIYELTKGILEALRKHFNKDWVIQDKDLTAGVFRQSF